MSEYNGGVAALHSKEAINEKKIRYCSRCEDLFQVQSMLGNRILGIDEVKQSDYDLWLQCGHCASLYQKNEVKVEPDLDSVKVLSDGKKGKIHGLEKKSKRIGNRRGNNPRLKGNRWEIKDSELNAELKTGAVLVVAYSSSDPTEPVV